VARPLVSQGKFPGNNATRKNTPESASPSPRPPRTLDPREEALASTPTRQTRHDKPTYRRGPTMGSLSVLTHLPNGCFYYERRVELTREIDVARSIMAPDLGG
jgi:hypothetical protein